MTFEPPFEPLHPFSTESFFKSNFTSMETIIRILRTSSNLHMVRIDLPCSCTVSRITNTDLLIPVFRFVPLLFAYLVIFPILTTCSPSLYISFSAKELLRNLFNTTKAASSRHSPSRRHEPAGQLKFMTRWE